VGFAGWGCGSCAAASGKVFNPAKTRLIKKPFLNFNAKAVFLAVGAFWSFLASVAWLNYKKSLYG